MRSRVVDDISSPPGCPAHGVQRNLEAMGAVAILAVFFVATAKAADPSSGWLSYAIFKAPEPTDIITKLSAKMTVPETPKSHAGTSS